VLILKFEENPLRNLKTKSKKQSKTQIWFSLLLEWEVELELEPLLS
jgi:hypothetical protein